METANVHEIPERLQKLVEVGTQYLEVPSDYRTEVDLWGYISAYSDPKTSNNSHNADLENSTISLPSIKNYIYCELILKQTNKSFVFGAPKNMKTGEVAHFLISQTLPHLIDENYQWYIVHNNIALPPDYTVLSTNLKSGDVVFLFGEHHKPFVCVSNLVPPYYQNEAPFNSNLFEVLQRNVPTKFSHSVPILVSILTKALDSKESASTFQCSAKQALQLKELLATLAEREILAGNALLRFGDNSQFGDITIRDIVAGNVYYVNVNTSD